MTIDEKLETLQNLVKVPNVDDHPEESLRAMKMLNLIVDIRFELSTLKPSDPANIDLAGVVKSCESCHYCSSGDHACNRLALTAYPKIDRSKGVECVENNYAHYLKHEQ